MTKNKQQPEDFFGVHLKVGDIVVFNPPRYKRITIGLVEEIYPKSVKLTWKHNGSVKETLLPSQYCSKHSELSE